PLAAEFLAAHPQNIDDVALATRFALDRLQKTIEHDLTDFGVRFDSWLSEASIVNQGLVEKCIEAMRARGYVQDYDGAVWFVKPGDNAEEKHKDKDRVLRR